MASTEYTIKIPEGSDRLISYWAKSVGWQPTIVAENGDIVPNPTIAIEACFAAALMAGSQQAVHQMAMEAAEEARVAAMSSAAEMMQAILQETTFSASTIPDPLAGPRGIGINVVAPPTGAEKVLPSIELKRRKQS